MLGEGLCTRLPLMQARAETAAVRAWTLARPIATWRQRERGRLSYRPSRRALSTTDGAAD